MNSLKLEKLTVSVENISDGTAIDVENANIIIDRVA